ncbi:MAG TPA: hypothetical protein VEN81_14950, partial [Planctomycetota bacterium]|nr:hypothetical protein [Planctomycetota bacterium]
PHPRIAPGPFEVVWKGIFAIQDADTVAFGAFLAGEVTLTLDGQVVLEARSEREAAWVAGKPAAPRKPGRASLEIRYRSLPGVPARLQIHWEGRTFAREPLPPWRLKHLEPDAPDPLALRGREIVGRLGCARCHPAALPGVDDPPPGPSLADVGDRAGRTWLLQWLEDPSKVRAGARMPSLFSADRTGQVERWIVADALLRATSTGARREPVVLGDHRMGKRLFIYLGCFTCHFVPDEERGDQLELGRIPLEGLNDRMATRDFVAFLANPHARYPDGRMPRLPVAQDQARDIAAYVLMWSKPPVQEAAVEPPVTPKEIDEVGRRVGARGVDAIGQALLRQKGCVQCHVGLGERAGDIPMAKPEAACRGPRFTLDGDSRKAVGAYLEGAALERHPSPFESRRRMLARVGCVRCHARDSDRPPPIEEIGSTLGGSMLETIPFQRTPRLMAPLAKYSRAYLVGTIRDGVGSLRGPRYTYRMPSFGTEAETIVQALAEADGDLAGLPEPAEAPEDDPTLSNLGPSLVGFEGYSCVSCHLWNGQRMSEADPGALGPELTSVTARIRHDWYDRWMDEPVRVHPGTPMPQIFKKGQPASLKLLDGDPARQKDAIWAYLRKGKSAPSPKPLPPLEVALPPDGPLVAQVPVTMPDKAVLEAIVVLYPSHDLVVYDLGTLGVRNVFTGARLLRNIRGRIRGYSFTGTPVGPDRKTPAAGAFAGYDRLPDGVRIRTREGEEEIRLVDRTLRAGATLIPLPPASTPPPLDHANLADPGRPEGPQERPGYRAIAYPMPKLVSGEDRVMPVAIAAHPRDGRIFVASMKMGELLTVRDPEDNGKGATFEDYTGGLFQEAFSMVAESDGLYVLHRRNLTRIQEKDGKAERFDRILALPQGVADDYDYGYGLVRESSGAFVWTHAPHANQTIPGSGSLLRWTPGEKPQEVAFGFRNPLGWCAGPEGTIFFTDNQGEWVATNKLTAIVPGRYYGYPNRLQKEHTKKPMAKPTVWVPYGWAHSLNGVTYDQTGGKFGPFAGQFFIAELMYGGAIIRAAVEQVNGEWQGCAFPFWGKGLLGPVVLTFDPKGRLWVGSLTEPGWMAQPDRGGLFRIDFTGEVPFEMKEIRVLPKGFRIIFTRPVDPASAREAASYSIEHYRYEYTGAYGSPELDRTPVGVASAAVAADGLSVDLATDPLVRDRIYLVTLRGLKSSKGESAVNPIGAYTLNEIPR